MSIHMAETNRLRCHVVGCDRECIEASYQRDGGPYDVNYFCPEHTDECEGIVLREPWRTELSREMIEGLLESMPFTPTE